MLEIRLESIPRLDSIGRKLRVATAKKTIELTDIMYGKVMENVTGKILQKKSGELASSIQKQIDDTQDIMVGAVFVEPPSAKAYALEFGGEKNYLISPVKSAVLKFFWEKKGDVVFLPSVNHPPSKEFAYLRMAAEEMRTLIPSGYKEAIEVALGGNIA